MTRTFPRWVRRTAVIGDVGGHVTELRTELSRLGARDDGTLPDDLGVIQVGDLVHRGPHSAEVVSLVDRILTTQPQQWLQLAGNHEALYLAHPVFEWSERVDAETADRLRRWWAEGSMRVAAAVVTEDEEFLITHAGLTAGFWRWLGGPTSASDAADALNGLIGTGDPALFRPGSMLRNRRGAVRPRGEPGPLWAQAGAEVIGSWRGVDLPFSQIHGHSSVVDWTVVGSGEIPIGEDAALRTDAEVRHAHVHLRGGRIIGIDPGHGRDPSPWGSLVLQLPA